MQHRYLPWLRFVLLPVIILFVIRFPVSLPPVTKAQEAPTSTPMSRPLTGITQIVAGSDHTCALTTNGTVKCWGDNDYGQLGDGTTTGRLNPVVVNGLNSNITDVVAGVDHTCALTSSSVVKCWGNNSKGQLGDGSTTHRLTPVTVNRLDSDVIAIVAGGRHTCALSSSGIIRCWGHNVFGQLGDGSTTDRFVPVVVSGLGDGTATIAAGYQHTCAVGEDSVLYCWGNNAYGQLGDGTTIQRTVPVAVSNFSSSITTIATGWVHTCALTINDTVKCWGNNSAGQLGDGSTVDSPNPVSVSGLSSGVTAVTAGLYLYTCAAASNDTIKCWGHNSNGQLGDGSTVDSPNPVSVSGLSSGVTAISAGFLHVCAIIPSSEVKCWGYNSRGQLGDGTTIERHAPVAVIDPNVPTEPTATTTATAASTTTPTSTATSTATPSSTSTGTTTATPTATPTPTAPPTQDVLYEPNNTCAQAGTIPTDGSSQTHTFHQAADVDWARFATTAGTMYRIEVLIPDGSPADVTLEVHLDCASLPTDLWNKTFAPGVQLDVEAPPGGSLFLRLSSQNNLGGDDVRYQLSVRPLATTPNTGAVILVAGRLKTSDPLQRNIHHVTNRVYAIFQGQGYTNDDIYYLATDSSLPGYDAAATEENLRLAITQWAAAKVGANRPLTLYLVDHGVQDQFYLDGPADAIVTPAELNSWLETFEQAVPSATVNVILEACYIGSFIATPNTISKANRLIITSSDSNWSAYASQEGAHFSDHFLTELQQGRDLYTSFDAAQQQVKRLYTHQNPWLDANGNGKPNEQADFAIAAERGFAYAGTLDVGRWPPYISGATGPTAIAEHQGQLTAQVLDDQRVDSVWAVVYAPSYVAPTSEEELLADPAPTLLLTAQGNNRYTATYPGFTEIGTYRIVFHAKDELGNLARPVEVTVEAGSRLYLPIITR